MRVRASCRVHAGAGLIDAHALASGAASGRRAAGRFPFRPPRRLFLRAAYGESLSQRRAVARLVARGAASHRRVTVVLVLNRPDYPRRYDMAQTISSSRESRNGGQRSRTPGFACGMRGGPVGVRWPAPPCLPTRDRGRRAGDPARRVVDDPIRAQARHADPGPDTKPRTSC